MAATLGLRGSGNFSSDERPQNWREMILYLFPNGEAPLTALLSMLKSQPTDDPQYNWWEKRLPTQRLLVSGTQALGITNLLVVAGAKDCVMGTILYEEVSGEIVKVTADPVDDTHIQVSRGYGAVAAAQMTDQDGLTIIGNVHEEGAKTPTAKTYSPVKKTNYTQIFRMPLYLTRTARKTKLRWDNTGPYREARREALSLHSIEMEKGFFWGDPKETIGPAGFPERMTGGLRNFMSTNVGGKFTVSGPLDEDTLDSMLEDIFRYGSTEKLVLAGSTLIRAITTLGKRNGTINLVPTDQVYGMKLTEYISAFGTLLIKNHPLFSQHAAWRQNGFVIDTNNLMYRYIDDTMFIKNRQDPGEDASKDEYLTECGLEVYFEETHAYIQKVTGALIQ
jgi:hypothetical protein